MFANTDAMVQAPIVICYQVAMVGAGRGKVIDEGAGENLELSGMSLEKTTISHPFPLQQSYKHGAKNVKSWPE